ncbi:MAG: hypothetical protein RI897_2429 [Verrucomicrobiota bacterium]|jgi:hypothetical protein
MDTSSAADIRKMVQSHLKLFWVLLVVVGANVLATFLPFDGPLKIGLQVGLALAGGALVLLFYMHFLSETMSTYMLLFCTFFLFAAMMALILVARSSHPDETKFFMHKVHAPAAHGGGHDVH